MISSPHTFHKSPPTHPWWLFHPSFRPLRLFSEIKLSTSPGMTFSKPGIFRPALCSASPPSSSGSPCTPSPSPTYHQQLKESGSTTGGKSGQKQVKRGRKISDKNQVLLLGPSVHTWLSNQAGTTAGGGLYSTTQLATHPTKQDDNPEKFGGNCTPGTKLLLNHQNSFGPFPPSWSSLLDWLLWGQPSGSEVFNSRVGAMYMICVTESYQSLFSGRHCVHLHWLLGPKSHLKTKLILTQPRSNNSKNNSHPT